MKKILLIGGGGYIGNVISKFLLDKEYEVTVLDNFIYKHQKFCTKLLQYKKFDIINVDLQDLNSYEKKLEKFNDVVILAGLVGDPITKKYPLLSKKINEDGLSKLIEHLSNLENIDHTIFSSTCSNYGLNSNNEILNEESPLNPLSLYANSKIKIENQILNYNKKKNFFPTIFRFATAFGLSPRMRFDLTINDFVKELYLDKTLEVYDPETWRPYCHVKDFAEIIFRCLNTKKEKIAFEVFNAGSTKNNHNKHSIIEKISNFIPVNKVSFVNGGQDTRNYIVNFDKLKKFFDFEPIYNIEDGIQEIINFIKNNKYDDKEVYGNYFIDSYQDD